MCDEFFFCLTQQEKWMQGGEEIYIFFITAHMKLIFPFKIFSLKALGKIDPWSKYYLKSLGHGFLAKFRFECDYQTIPVLGLLDSSGWCSSVHHLAFPVSATARNVPTTVLTFYSTCSNEPVFVVIWEWPIFYAHKLVIAILLKKSWEEEEVVELRWDYFCSNLQASFIGIRTTSTRFTKGNENKNRGILFSP